MLFIKVWRNSCKSKERNHWVYHVPFACVNARPQIPSVCTRCYANRHMSVIGYEYWCLEPPISSRYFWSEFVKFVRNLYSDFVNFFVRNISQKGPKTTQKWLHLGVLLRNVIENSLYNTMPMVEYQMHMRNLFPHLKNMLGIYIDRLPRYQCYRS